MTTMKRRYGRSDVKFAQLDRIQAAQYGVNLTSTGATNTIGQVTTNQFGSTRSSAVGGEFTISDALNIFAFRPDLKV